MDQFIPVLGFHCRVTRVLLLQNYCIPGFWLGITADDQSYQDYPPEENLHAD